MTWTREQAKAAAVKGHAAQSRLAAERRAQLANPIPAPIATAEELSKAIRFVLGMLQRCAGTTQGTRLAEQLRLLVLTERVLGRNRRGEQSQAQEPKQLPKPE